MNGVTFGALYHSYDDLDLILSSKIIGSPSVKTSTVDVPGADGVLDFTEFFGEPKYNNRTLTFEFSSIKPYSQQLAQDSTVKNALHGRKMKIVLDDDFDHYFYGRISVGDWKNEKNVGKLTITCDCDPWKYYSEETVVTQSIDTTEGVSITLSNSRRSVSPQITTTAEVTIAWEGGSSSLSAGNDWTIPELVLKEGNTVLTCTGTTTLTFKYRQGEL